MTRQDEIMEMAREAGWGNLVSMPHVNALERFAAIVEARAVAKEREACAQLTEHNFSGAIAERIRNRSNT